MREYRDDKLDFIESYNELIITNKVLHREIFGLKKHLGLLDNHHLDSNGQQADENSNILNIKPQI